MIKFRCPQCSQKLGVPDEYANRRVRCSKCAEPCRVPQPAPQRAPQPAGMDGLDLVEESPPQAAPSQPIEPVKRATKVESPPPTEIGDPFAGLNLQEVESGPDLDAISAIRNARNKQRAKASVKMAKSSRKSARQSSGGGAAAGLAIGAGKIPLAIATSLAFGIGACIAWTILTSLTGWLIPYVAVGVAAATACGLILFTENRNAGFGIAAIFISLFCILIGKVMIAKWAVMPLMQKEMEVLLAEEEENLIAFSDMKLEEQQGLTQDDTNIYSVGVMELWEQGEFGEDTARKLVAAKYNFFEQENALEPEYQDSHEAVNEEVASWDNDKKLTMFNQHYDTFQINEIKWLMQVIGALAAFIAAFSFFDLFILPISCVTAYKIGAGTN